MATGMILMPQAVTAPTPTIQPQQIMLTNASPQQAEVLQYMGSVTNNNRDFILTMYAESAFNPKAQSETHDSGICQRHIPAHHEHKNVINDSIQKQVDECRAKRKLVPNKGKYRFGYNCRLKYKNRFYTLN